MVTGNEGATPIDAPLDQEVPELLAQLVRIDSTDPGRYEAGVEQFVRRWLQERIAAAPKSHAYIERLEALPGRFCLRATIPAAGDSSAGTQHPSDLTLLCHMDTVVLGAGWSEDTPPLGAIVRDGQLWGRGSCDMKGGLACAMLAFADALAECQKSARLPQHLLSLLCTVDEEDHASTPWRGADATAAMAEAICRIRAGIAALPAHPELGTSTVTFGQISGGYSPYVVPDECQVTIDMRLVPPTSTATAEKLVRDAAAAAEQAVPGTHAEIVCTGDRPPVVLDANSPLLSALADASQQAGYGRPQTDVFTGYTDSAVVAGTCGNPNCLSYGPGSLELAHKPDEHVPLSDLARVRAVLSQLARYVLWS